MRQLAPSGVIWRNLVKYSRATSSHLAPLTPSGAKWLENLSAIVSQKNFSQLGATWRNLAQLGTTWPQVTHIKPHCTTYRQVAHLLKVMLFHSILKILV